MVQRGDTIEMWGKSVRVYGLPPISDQSPGKPSPISGEYPVNHD